jgi:hypothetical protein
MPRCNGGRAGKDAVKVFTACGRCVRGSAQVIEDTTTYRSKAKVLADLSKALQFSPESLEANRKGQLSKEQAKKLAASCFQPVFFTFLFAVVPFLAWTHILSGRRHLPFLDALPALLHDITHVNDLFDAEGKMGGIIILGSILVSLAIAVLMAFRISLALCADVLDRKVSAQEGRVVAREETINRANGRDPIEKYFFCLRYLTMPVNRAAYRAIEPGSIYLVYLLPRSELLVAMEPKMEDTPEMRAAQAATSSFSRGEGSSTRIDGEAPVQPTNVT